VGLSDLTTGDALGGRVAKPVLEIDGLRTEFHLKDENVVAVDGVSFYVDEGECVGLVGESGCGKTTVGLSVMRLLPNVGHITGGEIKVLGRDLAPLSEQAMDGVRGNEIGMVFQDPLTSLNPTMTIGDQIAEGVRLHRGASKEAALERAREVLELVEMPRPSERLGAYPHQLSGGLRQRVMIAMALACEPKLLIADEPTTALDVTIQAQILDLLDNLRDRLRMAVLLITHDMGVIASRADRVLVMYAGKIAESARTTELFTEMRHPYAEALLASVAKLDQDPSIQLVSIAGVPPDLAQPIEHCRFAPRCRYAQADCLAHEPPLVPAAESEPDHLAACFHQVDVDPATIAKRPEAIAKSADHTIKVDDGADIRQRGRAELIASAPELLRVEHLVKEYPVTSGAVVRHKIGTVKAVSDLSFVLRRGETFGLVGESGSGKTTVGRLVVALERPTSGTVEFEGQNVARLSGRSLRHVHSDLQMMFQDPYASLDPRTRVGTTLREPLTIQRIGARRDRDARVQHMLEEVGLPGRAAELYPHEFSGGQRQRIGLARALALEPKLIVADEPVSALDVSIQAQILNLLKALQSRHQLTYLFISHDLAVVRYMADTIGVMYLGKLVEVGPARDVYARAAHPYTQALIDAIPIADPSERSRHVPPIRGELPSAVDPPSGCRFRTRCPRATDQCAAEEPPLRPFGDEHLAACHHPLQSPRFPTERAPGAPRPISEAR